MRSTHESDGLFWRIFPDVRRQERQRFVFFALLSGMISLAQTVGLAGSDALFLMEFGAKALPETFIVASVAAVSGSFGYALLVGRTRNDGLYVWMLVGAALVLAAGVAALALGARAAVVVFFCSVYVTQAVFVNLHYPNFAADYFDSVTSKRIFPYLVACGSIGGILGGLLALGLCRIGPTENLVVAWAVGLAASAGLVWRARHDLKRWIPVGAEADEASAEGMLSALRFLQRSPIARWLTVSVVGMVLALFLMQYLEMKIFSESFDSPEALASFIAIYLAVANGVEIVILRGLTPFLLRRFGIAQVNLIHPLLTLMSFGALAFEPLLAIAVVARSNRELMDNALAAPVRALAYNVLPFRFRGRLRAFLEGIVFYASMSIAGVALVLLGDSLETIWLCAAGSAGALLYAMANLLVRREYVRSIVGELRSGRLDLDDIRSNLGDSEVMQLAEQWERSLAEEIRPSRGWRELPALLARHGLPEPIRRGARHASPAIRVACLEALSDLQDSDLEQIVSDSLSNTEPSVRLAAVRAAGRMEAVTGLLQDRLLERLQDPDPGVRAQAAVLRGPAGLATLRPMLRDGAAAEAIEVLTRLPRELLPEAQGRLDDDDPGVRAAAIDCFARLGEASFLELERLVEDLEHPDARVRIACVRALGARLDERSIETLASALDDPNRKVRDEAATTLGAMGELGVRAATPALKSIRRWTADAGLRAMALAATPSVRAVLGQAFRERVREAWWSRVACELVPAGADVPSRFLRAALEDVYERSCWIAFQALELLEDPVVVRSVRKALEYDAAWDRADALEALSNLGEREPAHQLSLLLEEGPIAEKLQSLPATMQLPTRAEEVLQRAETSSDRWLELAALGQSLDLEAPPTPEVRQEVRTMEGLLALRGVPFFAHLSLEQLEALGRFMDETVYLAGEVVVREGEPGDELYVILEGEAQAFKNYETAAEIELSTHSPDGICYFGEIAILDRAARSATVVVTKDARLLALAGDRFMELILQAPEISFDIFRVITRRLRAAEERLRTQTHPAAATPEPDGSAARR